MGAWDFNGNEVEIESLKVMRRRKMYSRVRTILKKKNCVTGSVQLTVLSKMEEKLLIK